jgi:Serine aminopeptidase, S33
MFSLYVCRLCDCLCIISSCVFSTLIYLSILPTYTYPLPQKNTRMLSKTTVFIYVTVALVLCSTSVHSHSTPSSPSASSSSSKLKSVTDSVKEYASKLNPKNVVDKLKKKITSQSAVAAVKKPGENMLKFGDSEIAWRLFPSTTSGGKASAKGDVFFFHGFADCFSNHAALFTALNTAGFNVISFDYPSHGHSSGGITMWGDTINAYDFERLATVARDVYKASGQASTNTPLYVSGWSTGGLLATRITQGVVSFGKRVEAQYLIAPGIAVQALVGNLGVVTVDTLTSNPSPPAVCPIKPKSPLMVPLFAVNLLKAASRAQRGSTKGAKTYIVLADPAEDKYVKSDNVAEWGNAQKAIVVQCSGAKHWLEAEPAPVGDFVISEAVRFFTAVSKKDDSFAANTNNKCAIRE